MKYPIALEYFRNVTPFRKLVEVACFVTPRCNFACGHCFNRFVRANDSSDDLLPLADMDRFARTLPNLWSLLLTGGEPFLRDDLSEICRIFYRHGQVRFIAIPTNASLPDAVGRIVPEIMDACPNAFVNISPSLDQIGSRRDDWTGFRGSFDRFLQTYERLTDLARRYPRLSINIITTFHRGNQEDIFNILRFVIDDLKAPSVAVNLVRGRTADRWSDKDLDIGRYARATARAEAYSMKNRAYPFRGQMIFLHLRRSIRKAVLRTCVDKAFQIPCLSGRVRMTLNHDGRIAPCEPYLFDRPESAWGHIRDYGFNYRNLIDSDRYRASIHAIRGARCHCRSECDLFYNILFNPIRFLRLLTEPLVVNGNE